MCNEKTTAVRWLCAIGVHRWGTREVHVTAPSIDKFSIQAAVIERCACGESRIAPSGGSKTTLFFMPDKFARASCTPSGAQPVENPPV